MITSKGIKTLCYVVMGLVFVAAVILLFSGIIQLADKNKFGFVWIVLSIIFPLITTVSLYPIFALASIDENISMLNQKIDKIVSDNKHFEQEKSQSTVTTGISRTFFTPAPTIEKENGDKNLFECAEAIDYVNKKYGISIFSKDDFYTIKDKIASIDDGGFSALILKRKVQEASSIDEVINILVMHKVANG